MNEAQCPSAFLKLADKPCLVVSHGTLAVFLQFLCFYLIIILQVVQLFETPGILSVSPNHRDFADGPNPAEQYMLKHTHTPSHGHTKRCSALKSTNPAFTFYKTEHV